MFNLSVVDIYPCECPYSPGRTAVYQSFMVYRAVEPAWFDAFLGEGFRKFGGDFFRPVCFANSAAPCLECLALRVPVEGFRPRKGQRRVLARNERSELKLFPLDREQAREEHFSIYAEHSRSRFGREESRGDFFERFYFSPVKAWVTELHIDSRLAGVGFLDEGAESLSSVYFAWAPEFTSFSPGVFTALKEIEMAQRLGKKYYYPGLCRPGEKFSEYKAHLLPHERLNMKARAWEPAPAR